MDFCRTDRSRARVLLPALALAALITTLLPVRMASAAAPRPSAVAGEMVTAAAGTSRTTEIITYIDSQPFVSANLSVTDAPLQARATIAGAWEKFTFTSLGGDQWSIRSVANGKYVTANTTVSEYAAPLQARANTVGQWEKFAIVDNGNATRSIIALANGLHVTANASLTDAPLQARTTAVGMWEYFFIPGF